MSIVASLEKTFTDMNIISAVTSTIFIIILGFYLRKKGIFGDNFGKILSKVVLTVALPALALNSFMQDISNDSLKQGMNILIWGIIVYILLIFISKPIFIKFKGDKQDTLRVLTIFGSTTFFGIPIVGAIYGVKGVLYASIFNIGYRIFLYSYGYIKMSGLKIETKNIKTMFLNPIVIATFLGLILWLVQHRLPQVTVLDTIKQEYVKVSFLRIDKTAVWLFKPLTYLASLASPLAWLAIGCTLGNVSLKSAISDKTSWFYSIAKVVVVPLINVLCLAILTVTNILPIDIVALGTIVIMMATPTATVAAAYAISFDKEALIASNASLISTICSIILIPVWIVVVEIISGIGLF